MISKGSRLGVGSLISVRASDGLRTVSGDLRLLYFHKSQRLFSSFIKTLKYYGLHNYPGLLPKNGHSIPDPLLLFRQGKEAGFTHYFHQFYSPISYFAQGILKSKEAAEDIVADSFIKLWERRDQLESSAAIRAYLYATVRNGCIDLLRREKRKMVYLEEARETMETEEKPVIHRIIEAESMNRIYTAMEALPSRCGDVFRLFYLEGKSLNEIAEELGIATTTVISQKKRAIQLLRKNLPPKEALILVVWLMS